MKLFLCFFFFIIICISNICAAPGEMIFKIVVPDNIAVDSFNVGGKVKNDGENPVAPVTTTLPTTTTLATTTTFKRGIEPKAIAKSEETEEE